MLVLGLMLAFAAGAAAGWLLRPSLELRVQKVLPFLGASIDAAEIGGRTLASRLEVTIAEIEKQVSSGLDRDRNATRLQILREVQGGE